MPVWRFAHRLAVGLLLAAWAIPARAELSEADRQIYREAFRAAHSGDWAAAGQRTERAHDKLLAKVLWWANLSRGGSGAIFSDFAEFLSANPDWPSQTALRQHAEVSMAGVPDKTLLGWFERFPPVTPAGKFKQADLWIAAGREQDGIARIREIWIDGDFIVFEEKTALQRYHQVLREGDHWARLDRLLWDEDTEAARRMMPFVDPDHRALAEARIRLAELEPGIERLLAKVPPQLANDPGLLYERLRWRVRKERYDEAVAIIEHPPRDLVRPVAWATQRQALARHALGDGDISLAYRLAARHGLANGPVFAELEFLAGWIALRFLHEPDIAYNHFVRLYDEVKLPVSVARGAYWSARAAETLKYREVAAAWYRTAAEQVTTYYGQLAATTIGLPSLAHAVAAKPSAAEKTTFEKHELVRVLIELSEVGGGDYMRPFARRLSELAKTPAEHVLLAHLMMRFDRGDLAVGVAKRASYAGVFLLEEGYPVTDLPPGGHSERALVLAMTRQESAFDREAISSAGALGMMQLMPATASTMAKSLRMPFSAKRLLTDQRYNVTLGRHYLETLIADFSGSYVLSVAAYNAGPSRVRQWMRDFGDPRTKTVDVIDWIESIPLGETRNYVQRVMENLQIYRVRLGDHGATFSIASDLRR
ncbi:MAG TPA: lytic transglycosylase domain-containing protein [Stellaceae bacterium]|nr:lytic transglycosylase domain-containing protein [Stellaceae bacterium]